MTFKKGEKITVDLHNGNTATVEVVRYTDCGCFYDVLCISESGHVGHVRVDK